MVVVLARLVLVRVDVELCAAGSVPLVAPRLEQGVQSLYKFCLEGHLRKEQHPEPDPFVKGTNPRIRIHTVMSWIRNTYADYADPTVSTTLIKFQ